MFRDPAMFLLAEHMRDDPATEGLAARRAAQDRDRRRPVSDGATALPHAALPRSTLTATRQPSSCSPPAPPASPRASCTPIAGSKRWATATAPACRRSRATSSSPPANGASSARSATTCCSRCATAPPARSWRIAPRPSASCRPSSATASRCCIRSRRSTGASSARPASSTASISPRCAAPTPPASRWKIPSAKNGRRASAARSGSTTASRKRRW